MRFVVAGTGTAEAELKAQAKKLGLARYGSFIGWAGDDLLHSLYRVADLCIVPSIYEPFGLVALEAMASGCLCVVADTGGLREVFPADGTVGLRFPSSDADALREIVSARADRRRGTNQLVTEAREHVLRFDWTEVTRRTLGVYDALAMRRAARSRRLAAGGQVSAVAAFADRLRPPPVTARPGDPAAPYFAMCGSM